MYWSLAVSSITLDKVPRILINLSPFTSSRKWSVNNEIFIMTWRRKPSVTHRDETREMEHLTRKRHYVHVRFYRPCQVIDQVGWLLSIIGKVTCYPQLCVTCCSGVTSWSKAKILLGICSYSNELTLSTNMKV